jgi:hypothetical protein
MLGKYFFNSGQLYKSMYCFFQGLHFCRKWILTCEYIVSNNQYMRGYFLKQNSYPFLIIVITFPQNLIVHLNQNREIAIPN